MIIFFHNIAIIYINIQIIFFLILFLLNSDFKISSFLIKFIYFFIIIKNHSYFKFAFFNFGLNLLNIERF